MDRWILAFWVLLGGMGLYGTHAAPARSGGRMHVMDGGILPPSKH